MKRVVITGIGIISSIGNNKKTVQDSLKKGKSGITFSQELKNHGINSQVCGCVKISTKHKNTINKRLYRFMNKSTIYAYLCMNQAIRDSKLTNKMISNYGTGIIIGSGIGSLKHKIISSIKKTKKKQPYLIIKSMHSSISACLSSFFKIKGVNYSISSACSTSTNCIGHATELIQFKKQKIIFAGGSEELCWEIAYGFDSMKILSTKYNNSPQKASRTYDENRDGFVISEGSGIIVIEELQHALKRNAHIYAEITGYGSTSDGKDIIRPSESGAIRCMKIALKNINNKIDYINSHGTSTIIGDITELKAIKKIFKKNNLIPPISSTKSITGHALGASGVHEVIYSILMMQNNFIAPSINIQKIDTQAKNIKIITKTTKKKINTIMTNNFGFGGTNATLIIQKFKY